jgi:hypothetical protein
MASWIQSNAVLNADSKKKLLASSSKKRKSSSGAGARSRGLGTCLSLFEEPPTSTISLEEFERFAIDRMHVLRGIHDLKTVQNLKGGTCLRVETFAGEQTAGFPPYRPQSGTPVYMCRISVLIPRTFVIVIGSDPGC